MRIAWAIRHHSGSLRPLIAEQTRRRGLAADGDKLQLRVVARLSHFAQGGEPQHCDRQFLDVRQWQRKEKNFTTPTLRVVEIQPNNTVLDHAVACNGAYRAGPPQADNTCQL